MPAISTKPGAKLGYRKSRKGCIRCKQRRVKCDEQVPCSACCRHKVPCSLESPGAVAPQGSRMNNAPALSTDIQPSPGSSVSGRSEKQSSASPTADLFSCFAHFQYGSPASSDDRAWMSDVELMHHYTVEAHQTVYTICHHDTKGLKKDLPQEGFLHPFLLHQILAFSALHLAYLNPDSRHKYLMRASQHQSVAISAMSSVLSEPWNPNACHALYGASIFVAISAFGTFPSCDRYNSFQPIDSLVDIFILIHGMNVILRSSDESIRNGPLRKLMSGCSCRPDSGSSLLATITRRLKDLLSHWEDQAFTVDQDKQKTLITVTAHLIEDIEAAIANQRTPSIPEQRVVFSWPMRFPKAYLTLLRHSDPLAMVVLSYYCVLMHSCDAKCWYFQGWSKALIKPIITSVAGTTWEELIQWPVDIIEKNMGETLQEQESMEG